MPAYRRAAVAASLGPRACFGIDFGTRGPNWDLGVSPDLPGALNVRAGATDGRFDLLGTRVSSFQLDGTGDPLDVRLRAEMGKVTLRTY